MKKLITVQEVDLTDRPRPNVRQLEWDDEPFDAKDEKKVRVISISFHNNSNDVKRVDIQTFSYRR